MKVKNKKSGVVFETTQQEFQALIIDKGEGYKYEVVSDGAPMEIKSLKEMRKSLKPIEPVEEVQVLEAKEEKVTKTKKK